jgi:hypothetical protein
MNITRKNISHVHLQFVRSIRIEEQMLRIDFEKAILTNDAKYVPWIRLYQDWVIPWHAILSCHVDPLPKP